jgi:hypothetical protein
MPEPEIMQDVEKESWESLAVLTQIGVLALALILGNQLEKRKVMWLGEAGSALLLGCIVGLACHFAEWPKTYISWIGFKKEVHYRFPPDGLLTLPTVPIIDLVAAQISFKNS